LFETPPIPLDDHFVVKAKSEYNRYPRFDSENDWNKANEEDVGLLMKQYKYVAFNNNQSYPRII